MTLDDFRQSLSPSRPPMELTPALAVLRWDAKSDWVRAHESAQQDEGAAGSWVHAYLHRKEGDHDNGAYWYGRAGRPCCHDSWINPERNLQDRQQLSVSGVREHPVRQI